ncbi:MAG: hypothetical protein PVI57_03945 [Gemmatimonadota bacterium]
MPQSLSELSGSRNRGRRAGNPHLEHVKEHLGRLASGVTSTRRPDEVYLGHDEGSHFWELVGLRMAGHPTVVLAAFRFHRQDHPGADDARESLAAYLSSPPPPLSSPFGAAMPGEISAYLPRWHEAIPAFLARLRAGPDYAPVHFVPRLVQMAFDFRPTNPSAMEAAKRRAGPMSPFLFRTTRGHVLRGWSRGPDARGGFIAVTRCEQLTPAGPKPVGSLMLNPEFIALSVPLNDEKTRLAAPNWMPFLPATASKRYLLA